MFTAYNYYEHVRWQQSSKILLAMFWCAGLMFGVSAARSAGEVIFLLMHRLYFQSVSIVGLLLRISFSFLITVLAVIVSTPWLFLPAALVRSFLLAFWAEGIILTGTSGVGLFFCLFSGNGFVSACSLLWLWFRHISGFRPSLRRDLLLCFVLHSIMCLAEFYLCGSSVVL